MSAGEFDVLLRSLGPFGPRPRLAVAVSGGADSMALLRLAAEWAAGQEEGQGEEQGEEQEQGKGHGAAVLQALTVDHGLRPEAAAEAAQVGDWCAAIGVAHATLRWTGPKPRSAVQERARAARYDLLTGWCRDNGFPHLLLAHHLDDQAETFLYRMSRGSGLDGLAAMPAVALRDDVRILRPLLTVPRARLVALLGARGQDWVEDPGNSDRRYARVRLRDRLAELERGGLGADTVAEAARLFGRLRAAAEISAADAAARCVVLHPEGHAELDLPVFRALGDDDARRILATLLAAVGGGAYRPRRDRLDRALAAVRNTEAARGGPTVRTLGNCVIDIRPAAVRIWREPGRTAGPVAVGDAARLRWDGRFDIEIDIAAAARLGSSEIGRLDERGWQEIADGVRLGAGCARAAALPGPVRFSLPALRCAGTVREVPHLGFLRPAAGGDGGQGGGQDGGQGEGQGVGPVMKNAVFRPKTAPFGPPFWVA